MSFAYTTDQKQRLGTIETPLHLSYFVYRITKRLYPKVILDPACGRGNLLKPWIHNNRTLIGFDTNREALSDMDLSDVRRHHYNFLELGSHRWFANYETPSLILCNPPWNRHPERKSYPEQFLRHIVRLFGTQVPIVFFCPMGLRLNQRVRSKRWRWISKNLEITSIISVPVDGYSNLPEYKVEFHSEVILFNVPKVKPHYWLDYLPENEN